MPFTHRGIPCFRRWGIRLLKPHGGQAHSEAFSIWINAPRGCPYYGRLQLVGMRDAAS
jgi:hypothetical protein